MSTLDLRQGTAGPVSFLCATLGSGIRLGADRDLDGHLNGEDCSPGDAAAPFLTPVEVTGLAVDTASHLAWDANQPAGAGPGVTYEIAGGGLLALRSSGLGAATSCVASGLVGTSYDDTRAAPPAGDGWFYLTRARNSCAAGTFGPGKLAIEPLSCP